MKEKLFSLKNRVALITGAGGLLGLHHTNALAEAGAQVVMVDILPENEIAQRYSRFLKRQRISYISYMSCDITDEDAVIALCDKAMKKYQRIDVLVNNAALNDMAEERKHRRQKPIPLEEFPIDAWKQSLSVNMTGTFICSKIFGEIMAGQGKGSIINIASTYGLVGPDQAIYLKPDGSRLMFKSPAYSATKGGVVALTKYLAAYWGSKGVRVNTLTPGGVRNGQSDFFIRNYSSKTMLGRMAEAREYEGAIVFLASDASSYMTGANLIIDGGWTAW